MFKINTVRSLFNYFLNLAYYRGAQAIVIAFDLIDKDTLVESETWLNDALKVASIDDQKPFIFLVGTKKDLIVNRKIIILKF